MDELREPLEGYVRAETLLPLTGGQIMKVPGLLARRALCLQTSDGALALGITAESAKDIAKALLKSAREMEKEEKEIRKQGGKLPS
jgi:hypothetical protein